MSDPEPACKTMLGPVLSSYYPKYVFIFIVTCHFANLAISFQSWLTGILRIIVIAWPGDFVHVAM